MNHTRIAAEAIRFRISTIRRPLVSNETVDVETMGINAVLSPDPRVAQALRVLAAAWSQAGFDPEDMVKPWKDEHVEHFKGRPELIDAIDVIVRAASGATAAA